MTGVMARGAGGRLAWFQHCCEVCGWLGTPYVHDDPLFGPPVAPADHTRCYRCGELMGVRIMGGTAMEFLRARSAYRPIKGQPADCRSAQSRPRERDHHA